MPAGGTDFDFTLSFGQPDLPFTLSDLEVELIEVQPFETYQVSENDPGPDYALTDIECLTTDPIPNGNLTIDRDNRSVEVEFEDGGASVMCIFTNTLVNACPVDPNVGNLQTDLLGVGQGSPTKGIRTRKLVIPNYQNVDSLYGQLAAVDVGVMN